MLTYPYSFAISKSISELSPEQIAFYASRPARTDEDICDAVVEIVARYSKKLKNMALSYAVPFGWGEDDVEQEAMLMLLDIFDRRLFKPVICEEGYAGTFTKYFLTKWRYHLSNVFRRIALHGPIHDLAVHTMTYDGYRIEMGVASFHEDYIRKTKASNLNRIDGKPLVWDRMTRQFIRRNTNAYKKAAALLDALELSPDGYYIL